MPEDEQIELVDAHPRLGAPPALVSAASFVEQGYDRERARPPPRPRRPTTSGRGSPPSSTGSIDAYEARFGFRYCVFVAGRSAGRAAARLRGRPGRRPEAELARAIDAVIDIAADRWAGPTAPERAAWASIGR